MDEADNSSNNYYVFEDDVDVDNNNDNGDNVGDNCDNDGYNDGDTVDTTTRSTSSSTTETIVVTPVQCVYADSGSSSRRKSTGSIFQVYFITQQHNIHLIYLLLLL